jgi:hypothetical protein
MIPKNVEMTGIDALYQIQVFRHNAMPLSRYSRNAAFSR